MLGNIITFLALMMPVQAGAPSIPKITIAGLEDPIPTTGEIVVLKADYDRTKVPEGMTSLSFNWTVIDEGKPKTIFVIDNGSQIAFGGGIKDREITVILDVNCEFQTKKVVKVLGADGKATDQEFIVKSEAVSPAPLLAKVTIGKGTPLPSPTPNPFVPGPVVPESPLGLTKFAYDLFSTSPSLGDTPIKIIDPNTNAEITYANGKVLLATKLAEGLEGIAGKIAGVSTYRDVAVILADTKNANKLAFSALPIDLAKTVTLKEGINAKMKELWDTRKINTAEDIANAWREISQGLRLIK